MVPSLHPVRKSDNINIMLTKLYLSNNIDTIRQNYQKILEDMQIPIVSPDLLIILNQGKIQLDDVRKIKQFLSLKPFQLKVRVVVVENIDSMGELTQNSILKMLEELPDTLIVILGGTKTAHLLPTFLSRIETVYLEHTDESQVDSKLLDQVQLLNSMSMPERFGVIEKVTSKEQFLEVLANYYRLTIHQHPELAEYGQKILRAEEWLNSNCNSRATLEYLMISMPRI